MPLSVAGKNLFTRKSQLGGGATADELDIAGLDDIGADIADADLLIIDDGGGGTNRKSAVTRIPTYVFTALVLDEDNMASDSAAKFATQQSIKAYVDARSITVSDGSSSTAITIGSTMTFSGTTNEIEVGESSGTVTIGLPDNVTIAGNLTVSGTTTTVSSSTITVNDPLFALADNNSGDAVDIGWYGKYVATGTKYSGLFRDASDSDKWKLFATSGNSNEAPSTTVNTTSGFALATLAVDGLEASSLTLGGTAVSSTAAELNILDGVTSTAAELNIVDGVTSATSTTVADADRVVLNDNGTMVQVAVTDLAAYFDDEITAMPNLVSTGALNGGSITSGFGTIDTGASAITTTGLISGGSLDIDDVLINGTTIGHTDDTDLMTLSNGTLTIAGEISVTTLDIGGTNVTSTAAELNILDGVTSTAAELNILDGVTSTSAELNIIDGDTGASTVTLADADRIVINDSGIMKQVALTSFETYFESAIDTLSNVTTVGTIGTGVWEATDVAVAHGGTGASTLTANGVLIGNGTSAITAIDLSTKGDILLGDGSGNPQALNVGSNDYILTADSTSATGVAWKASGLGTFYLEDDDGTEVSIGASNEVKFIGAGITTNWTDTSTGNDADPYDLTFTINAAQTGITSIYATDLILGEDAQTAIDFGTANEIDFKADNAARLTLSASAFYPVTNNQIDLGTSTLEFKDAFFDGTVTADAFAGPLTGNVTGNASGTAATVTTAAQSNITSLGTLTALTVDDVAIDGKVMTMTGSASDTAVFTAGTNGTLSIVTTDAAAAAANIQITADGTVDIDSAGVLTLDSGAAINIEPAVGSAILLDGTISIDAGIVTGATSITSTAFVGDITGNVTGNTSGTAATVTTAAQSAITSLGTLTTLQVDNININGNAITSTAGTDLTISPVSGQQIVLDGAIVIDAGVVTGATSITSTAFVGDITGNVTGTADVATVATTVTITDNESTDESNAIIFTAGGDVDGGNIGLESDGTLTYNPSTGVVTATGFAGALTGNVTGNASGTAATVTTAAQSAITSLGTLTALTVDDVAVDGKVITMTGSASDTIVMTAGTNGTLSIVTTDAAAAAANIQITADGTVDIDSAGVLTLDSGAAINIEPAAGSAILLDGTISVDAGVITGATSITSTAFSGALTGNVTGNTSGTAATVTGAAQSNITSLGTLTTLTVDDVAIDGKVMTMTGSSSDTAVFTAGTNGTLSIVTTDAAAAAANIQITADGTVDIDSAGVLTLDSGAAINIEPAVGSAILLDGTISIDAGVVTGATSITSTAFVGDITGDVTGNASGTAATVTTAAQTNITSLGTLTALTVDDVAVDGKVITMTGSSSDTAVMTVGTNGTLSIVTTDAAAAAANIQITADGTAELAGTTVTLDSAGAVVLDSATGIINIQDAGSTVLSITEGNSGDVTVKLATNAKDLVFTDNGDATNMKILDAAAGINVPGEVQTTGIGYTDGDNALTIADGGGITVAQDLSIADSKGIIFDSAAGTPGTDDTAQGIIIEFLAFEVITQWDAVYVSGTTGRVGKADANDMTKLPAIGVAIEPQGSPGSSVKVLTHGVYRDDGGFINDMAIGDTIYVQEAPGVLDTVIPDADGDFVQVMGVAIGARSAFINPDLTIIERA